MLKQKSVVSSHLEGRVQFWVNHLKRKLQPEKSLMLIRGLLCKERVGTKKGED